ncbi:unnamed protein product [Cylicostephanus goldi]|uniref:Laminin G domain-containing protein n=1 Tax=Cylicostephanus goldi TaxID=71465 RepID=A0A3P6RRB6_CYLGO|nr:unnamed protein product [Cylicostephanus goldi]
MDEGVFLGGAPPNIDALESKVGTTNGFHGCIRKLIINNDVLLDTENEVNTAVNLQDLGKLLLNQNVGLASKCKKKLCKVFETLCHYIF